MHYTPLFENFTLNLEFNFRFLCTEYVLWYYDKWKSLFKTVVSASFDLFWKEKLINVYLLNCIATFYIICKQILLQTAFLKECSK